jgi:hypothetical protein
MLRQDRARLDDPVGESHVGRMHEMDVEAGEYFALRRVIEIDERHRFLPPGPRQAMNSNATIVKWKLPLCRRRGLFQFGYE